MKTDGPLTIISSRDDTTKPQTDPLDNEGCSDGLPEAPPRAPTTLTPYSAPSALPLVIDPEFKAHIPPLTPDEYACLKAQLLEAKQCRDPLKVWKGHRILLDGHNRYEICGQEALVFRVVEIDLPDREHALLWIDKNQLGRRNLTDDQRAVIAVRAQERESAILKRDRAKKGAEAVVRKPDGQFDRLSGAVSDKRSTPAGTKRDTLAETVKANNLPERKLRAVKKIKSAKPELLAEVAAGKLTLAQARKALKSQEPKPDPIDDSYKDPGDIDELEAALSDVSCVDDPNAPWTNYNREIDRLVGLVEQLRDGVLGLPKLDAAFGCWVDIKQFRLTFSNFILTLNNHKVTNWSSTADQVLLPGGRPFLFALDRAWLEARRKRNRRR